MIKKVSGRERVLIFFGAALVITGIICNEWLYAQWFCMGAALDKQARVALRIFEAIAIGSGLAMIVLRRKDVTINVSILLLTLLFFFGSGEAYFRLFDPQISGRSESGPLFEYDSTLGWRLSPGKTGTFASKHEFETRITINSAGMRDREYSLVKPTGKKRIAVLGDSFTNSMGVDERDAFTKVMEDRLLKDSEVLNFGVNGYGPAQELLLLKTVAVKYRPDLVIMVIYVGNDFDDLLGISDWIDGYKRPKAVLDAKGTLAFSNIPVPRAEAKTGGRGKTCTPPRSHFVDFIDKRLRYDKNAVNFMPSEIRLCKKTPDTETREAVRLMQAILRETNAFCRKNGAQFMVAVAPTIVQTYERLYWKKIKKIYNLNDDDYDLRMPNSVLGTICREEGIPAIDLMDTLKANADRGQDVYYFRNQHWNRMGEQVVAGAISRFIRENKLI